MLVIAAILLLAHCANGHVEDNYIAFNVWTEDAYALDLLGVKPHSERSRVQCCALCSRDVTCFGVAWNVETQTCQTASKVDMVAYVDLVEVIDWDFMVEEEFVCGTELCKEYKTSCKELRDLGASRSAVYRMDFSSYGLGLYDVSCAMDINGGGWMVFQRREDGSEDFYRGWQEYADGFGSITSEFWLGNDLLHKITTSNSYKMRVDLEDFEGNSVYAEYTKFSIADATSFYTLLSEGYTGTAGDSLSAHNGQPFTTKDADHDTSDTSNCAVVYKGAWWYVACHASNLNGPYLGGNHSTYANGINWREFKGYYYSLKFTEMKIQLM